MDEKEPKIKILVACHKADPNIHQDDVYMPVQVGKALHPELDLGFMCDNTGDNISVKNASYCELTALYWAWKNLKDVDYIGLAHYRRYFLNNKKKEKANTSSIFNDWSALSKETVILPKFWNLPHPFVREVQFSVLNQDLYILYKVCSKYYPEYLPELEQYLLGNVRTGFNMFIMHKEVFDNYCEWLFDILTKVESHVKENPYTSYKRLYGYLGEILLIVYIMHNNLKISEREVLQTHNNSLSTKNPLKKIVKRTCNNLSYALDLQRPKTLHNDYWELYLKIDNIDV